ncbi:MAG: DUF805 domain-containing protein [Synechococcaceae cyanobacterium ELA263]
MNPLIDAFTKAWTRSFDYSGRSNRGDYWWFVLANAIISVVLLILSNVANLFGWIYSIWAIASIVPSISLLVRRLRDVGKDWPWIFISLIPVIGGIWLIVLLAQPSLVA